MPGLLGCGNLASGKLDGPSNGYHVMLRVFHPLKLAYLAIGVSFPLIAQAQVADTSPDINADVSSEADRHYWCALAAVSHSYEGKLDYKSVENVERKPVSITIPMTDREGLTQEEFSEDGRFYTYMRSHPESDSKSFLHGVFDLHTDQLSTANSYFAEGHDGVTRPYSDTYIYSCTKKD